MRHIVSVALISAWMIFANATQARVTIFAAASTAEALDAAITAYPDARDMRVSYASSGALAKQIAAGAPADLFLSANTQWTQWLADQGLIEAGTLRPFIANKLVLVGSKGAARKSLSLHGELKQRLGDRLALGAPASVPAGKYARQSLIGLSIWPQIQDDIIEADSVRSVLTWVERKEASTGMVYASDATRSKKAIVLAEIPDALHDPIIYPLAIMTGRNSEDVQRFFTYLTSPPAKAIFMRHGFSALPD